MNKSEKRDIVEAVFYFATSLHKLKIETGSSAVSATIQLFSQKKKKKKTLATYIFSQNEITRCQLSKTSFVLANRERAAKLIRREFEGNKKVLIRACIYTESITLFANGTLSSHVERQQDGMAANNKQLRIRIYSKQK